MAKKVTLSNGQVIPFPDTMTEEQIHASVADGSYKQFASAAAPAPTASTPTAPADDSEGSIFRTVGKKFQSMAQSFNAANLQDTKENEYGNDWLSDYAASKAKKTSLEARREEEKLSGLQSLAAGAIEYAPAVLAGMVNPLAGAAVMGGISGGEELSRQSAEDSQYDLGKAALVGAGSAGVDLATAGIGPAAGGAIRRGVRSVAGEWDAPIARQAARATESVGGFAGESAGTAVNMMGQQGVQNLAAGRDLTEGMGEAALTGVAMHGGIKLGGLGLKNINRALGFKFNKGGESAIDEVNNFQRDTGVEIPQDVAESSVQYKNARRGFFEDENSPLNNPDTNLQEATRQIADVAEQHADEAGPQGGYALFKKLGGEATPQTFNYTYKTSQGAEINPATQLGVSAEEAATAGRSGRNIITPHTEEGLSAAQVAGETDAAIRANNKAGYQKLGENVAETHNFNDNTIEKAIAKAKTEGDSAEQIQKLTLLQTTLKELNEHAKRASTVHKNETFNSDKLKALSAHADALAYETGIGKQLKDYSGTTGHPDFYNSIYDVFHAKKQFHANDAQVAETIPDLSKEKTTERSGFIGDTVGGVAGMLMGRKGAGRQLRRGMKNLVTRDAERKATLKAREAAMTRGEEIGETLRTQGLGGASREAANSLEQMGYRVNPTETAAPEYNAARHQELETQHNAGKGRLTPSELDELTSLRRNMPRQTYEARNLGDQQRIIRDFEKRKRTEQASDVAARVNANEARRKVKTFNEAVKSEADRRGVSTEEIHQAIHESGESIDKIHQNPKEHVKRVMKEADERKAKQAAADAEQASKAVDEELSNNNKMTVDDVAERVRRIMKDSQGEDFKHEIFENAVKEVKTRYSGEDGSKDIGQALNSVYKRLLKKAAKPTDNTNEGISENATKPENIQESREDLQKWVAETFEDTIKDPEVKRKIQQMILERTSSSFDKKPLTDSQVRVTLGKIMKVVHNHLNDLEDGKKAETATQKQIKRLDEKTRELGKRITLANRSVSKLDTKVNKQAEQHVDVNAKIHAKVSRAIEKVSADLDKELAQKVADKVTQIVGEDLSDERVMKLVEDVLERQSGKEFKSIDSADYAKFRASSIAAEEALRAEGKTQEASALKLQRETLHKGMTAKDEYEDHPYLWFSAEDEDNMRKALKGEGTSTYMGMLSRRIRLGLFGDVSKEVKDKYVRFGNDKITEIKNILRDNPQADLSRFFPR